MSSDFIPDLADRGFFGRQIGCACAGEQSRGRIGLAGMDDDLLDIDSIS
jgi:hypothetical protein